jgi:ATP-dependent DNA helicase RecG
MPTPDTSFPDDTLNTPAQFAPSVGPRRAPLLEKLGLHTVEDILWHLPRDVLDLTDLRAVQQLEEGIVQTVHGVVVDLDARRLARGKSMTGALLDCEGQYLRGVWFNQPWMLHKFEHGQHVLFSGKPKRRDGRWEMSHPQIQWLDDDAVEVTGGLLPRYGLTEGLKIHELRRITKEAVEKYVDLVPDTLPDSLREALKLPDLRAALRSLHLPESRPSSLLAAAGGSGQPPGGVVALQACLCKRVPGSARQSWHRRSVMAQTGTSALRV